MALCLSVLGASGAAAIDGTWSLFLDSPDQPPSRNTETVILDPVRDRLIVFGGPNGPPVDGAWAMSLGAAPNWTRLATSGYQPERRIWHSAIYDPVRDRMIVFGGDKGAPANDVWALSLSGTPTWSPLYPTGTPPAGRILHSAIYDPVRDRMIVFGGNYWLSDVWELTLGNTLEWNQLSPTGSAPPARSGHAAIYDPIRDRMIVFGGYTAGSTYLNDAWALSLGGTPTWDQIVTSGPMPVGREMFGAVYDPTADRLLVYGGINQGGTLRDLWSLPLGSTPQWSEVAVNPALPAVEEHKVVLDPSRERLLAYGGGSLLYTCLSIPLADPSQWQAVSPPQPALSPATRIGHSATYDPVRHRLLVAGGDRRSYDPSTWALSMDSREWHILATADPPSGLMLHSAIFDPIGDRLIAFGGRGNLTGPWQLSMADGSTWQLLTTLGPTPEGRSEAATIYDPVRHRMILFGGLESFVYGGYTLDDVWALSLDGTPTWTQLFPTGTRPSLASASAFYDPARDRMVVFGGCEAGGVTCRTPPTAPLWELSLGGSPAWSQIPQSGDIPLNYPAVLDAARDRAIVIGAVSPSYGVFQTAVWTRGLAAGSPWTRLSTLGQAPPLGPTFFKATFDPDARRALIAFAGDYPDAQDQFWALSFDAITGVEVSAPRLALSRVTPNPSAELKVAFELRAAAPATLELLDVTGRRLDAREVGSLGAGRHVLTLGETRRLSSGVYLLRLRQGAEMVTARATVLR